MQVHPERPELPPQLPATLGLVVHDDIAAPAAILREEDKVSSSTGRLKLAGDDLRFAINAMKIDTSGCSIIEGIKTLHAKCWFVKISDVENKQVWVNTNSLAKRLLLSKKEVEDLSATNKLTPQFLQTRAAKIQAGEKDANQALTQQADTKVMPLLRMQQAFKNAWIDKQFNSKNAPEHHAKFSIAGQAYRSSWKENKMHIYRWDDEKIGKGGFGTVSKVFDVVNG